MHKAVVAIGGMALLVLGAPMLDAARTDAVGSGTATGTQETITFIGSLGIQLGEFVALFLVGGLIMSALAFAGAQ